MFLQHFDDLWREVSSLEPAASGSENWDLSLLAHPEFGQGGEFDAALNERARAAKAALFGNSVEAVSPLYVSSICKERCTYCNYRAGSEDPGLKRVRLSDEEIAREVEFLAAEKGLRSVELVYASDPLLGADDYCRHARLAHDVLDRFGGGRVGLCAEPVSTDDYRHLHDAGVNFSVVWMETYDRQRYAELHPGNQTKSDYAWRLQSFERMLEAGIDEVGIGVLSGLADWRRDWAFLVRHQEWLRQQYGRGPSILGIPRLKPAPGAKFSSNEVPSDNEFRALISWHNLRFPDVRPWISTREEFDFGVELAAGGGCLFTFNCSVVPGGYTLENKGAQFVTGNYDVDHFIPLAAATGLRIHH